MDDKELITVDSILEYLERVASEKLPLPAMRWLEAASRLNALQGAEDDKWLDLEQSCARMRVELIQNGMSIAAAKAHVEAEDIYKKARQQKAKVERIKETIRIAKHRARLASDEMRS